jgi:hypothetical protein
MAGQFAQAALPGNLEGFKVQVAQTAVSGGEVLRAAAVSTAGHLPS